MRPYLACDTALPMYVFPGDESKPRAVNRCPIACSDLERLFERGDAYGFFAIAAAYREFHLKKSQDSQWVAARYLIKALPAFCRESCVRPHAEEAIALTKALLMLLPDTSFRIEVDDQVLRHQIDAVAYQPCRQLRLVKDGQPHEAPADPIVPYAYRRCGHDEMPLMLSRAG